MTTPTGPTHDTAEPAPYVAPAPARRPHWLAVAAVAVLAVGAGAFGVLALSAGDGAESPEAAVEAMFDAIDHEDVIGVLEALDPAERGILRPAVDETSKESKRVELAAEDLDLRKVSGIDLEVKGLTFTTESLGDGITAVDLTGGTVSTATDLDQLPLGATIKDILDEDEREQGGDVDRSSTDRIELAGTRLVATENGDGWHVSALYSLAEQLRLDEYPEEPVPDFGNGIAPKGADSPEAAVRDAIEAARTRDVRRLIELAPPGEADVLHDYGPILVNAAEEEGLADDPPIEVTNLGLKSADGPDGTKIVSAASFNVHFSDEYSSTTWAYDGQCTTTTWDYEDDDYGGGSDPETYKVCDGEQDELLAYSPFSLLTFSAPGSQIKVVTETHDGQWFVSPSRSILESTVGGLRSLSTDEARRLARFWSGDYWVLEPDSFWAACGVEAPPDGASSDEGEAAWDDCIDNLPEDYEGSTLGGWFGSSYDDDYATDDPGDGGASACYAGEDAAAVEACLGDLVASGAIPPEVLAEFTCSKVYEELPDDADDAAYEAADKTYDDCVEAATGGESDTSSGSGSSGTATSIPPPPRGPTVLTAPPSPSAPTTAPPASATTPPASATTAPAP